MANVAITNDAWTQLSITSGSVQNISATAKIEINSAQTDNSGIVLEPGEYYSWDSKTIYARAVTESAADIRVVDFKKSAGGGGGQSDSAPIGTIISYMGTTAPDSYLACDGTTYNIADYSDLATHITTQFGQVDFFGGDGTTTFAVPDLRGEFLRGTGTNSHTNQGSGANVGVHQDGTGIPYMFQDAANSPRYDYTYDKAERNIIANTDSEYGNGNTYFQVSGTAQTGNAKAQYTIRPTNTSVLYCIKYQ